MFCGHDGYFVADIFNINGVNVVNANGPVDYNALVRDWDQDNPNDRPTHHLSDYPLSGFWHPKKGVFVVPEDQVSVLNEAGEPVQNPKKVKKACK